MTGPEHYKAAENWLFKAEHHSARGAEETVESCAALAQVHATLAVAAAAALHGASVNTTGDWARVAGTEGPSWEPI